MKKLCIHHSNCADGFTSAWVVRKALGDNVEFYPGVHGQPPPDVTDRDVILVDFSYKSNVIKEMATKAKSILILDHHKSASDDIVGNSLCNMHTNDFHNLSWHFDMDKSGARITWDHYFPNQEPPKLILYVEDRDLWRFALPNSREINSAFFSYSYDFKLWDTLANSLEIQPSILISEGSAIERKHFKDIDELLKVVTRRMNIGGFNVPVANVPYTMGSDAGNILSKNEPFAGYYYDTAEGRVFGLRSQEGGEDVSLIATKYGGGGHKHASGFKLTRDEARKMEDEPIA